MTVFRERSVLLASWVPVGLACVTMCLGQWVYVRGLHDPYLLPKDGLFTVMGCLAGLWAAGRGLGRHGWASPLWFLPAGFFVGALISLARSASPLQGAAPLLGLVGSLGWAAFGHAAVTSPRHLGWILRSFAWGAAGVSLVGLGQWAGWNRWTDVPGLSATFERLGVSLPASPRFFETLPPVRDNPGSVAGHVNIAAESAVLGVLILLGLSGTRPRVLALRILTWLAAGLGFVACGWFVVLSGSRASWLAAVSGAAVVVWARLRPLGAPSWRRIGVAGGLLLAVASWIAVTGGPSVSGRGGVGQVPLRDRVLETLQFGEGTQDERFILWANTWAMVESEPVFGVGPGNWKIQYPRFARAKRAHDPSRFSLARQPLRPHQDLLQLLAETGVLGVLSLGGFLLIGGGVGWWRSVRREPDPRVVAAGAVMVGLLVLSMVAFPMERAGFRGLAFLLVGYFLRRPDVRTNPGRGVVPWLVLVIFAIGTVVSVLSFNGRMRGSAAFWRAQLEAQEGARRDVPAHVLPESPRMRLERARDLLDEAVARDPARYDYRLHQGVAFWNLGLGDAALRAFGVSLDLHPYLVQGMLHGAELLQRRGGAEDLAQAWEWIRYGAFPIHPDAPEVLLAMGRHFVLMAETSPGQADVYRRSAIAALREASDPARRAYMPEARLLLASTLLENGSPIDEILTPLRLAERDASLNPGLLVQCGRLYADPRMGAVSPLFGPSGEKTTATFARAARVSGNRNPDAVLEVRLAPWHRYRAGGPRLPKDRLESLESALSARLSWDPNSLLARYHRAGVREEMGQIDGARRDWALVVRGSERRVDMSRYVAQLIRMEAAEAAARLAAADSEVPR